MAADPNFQKLEPQDKQVNFLKWSEYLKQYGAENGEDPKTIDASVAKIQSQVLPSLVGERHGAIVSGLNTAAVAINTSVSDALQGTIRLLSRPVQSATALDENGKPIKQEDSHTAEKINGWLQSQSEKFAKAHTPDPYAEGVANPVFDPSSDDPARQKQFLIPESKTHKVEKTVAGALPMLLASMVDPALGVAYVADQVKGETYNAKLAENKTKMTPEAAAEDAEVYSDRQAFYTIPQTALFLGAGAVGAKLAGTGGSAVGQAVRSGAASFGANLVVSDLNRNLDGIINGHFTLGDLAPTTEDVTMSALFSLPHAYAEANAYKEEYKHLNSIVVGEHPQIKGQINLAADPLLEPDRKDTVLQGVDRLQTLAKIRLYEMGSRTPDVVAAYKGEAAPDEAAAEEIRKTADGIEKGGAPLTAEALRQKADNLASDEDKVKAREKEFADLMGPAGPAPAPKEQIKVEIPTAGEAPKVTIPPDATVDDLAVMAKSVTASPAKPADKQNILAQLQNAVQEKLKAPMELETPDHTTLAGAQAIMALHPDEQVKRFTPEVRAGASKVVADHNLRAEEDAAQQKVIAEAKAKGPVTPNAHSDLYLKTAHEQLYKPAVATGKPEEGGEAGDTGNEIVTSMGAALRPHSKLLGDRGDILEEVQNRVMDAMVKHHQNALEGKPDNNGVQTPLFLLYKDAAGDTITPSNQAQRIESVRQQAARLATWKLRDVLKEKGKEPGQINVNDESAPQIGADQVVVPTTTDAVAPEIVSALDKARGKSGDKGKIFVDYLKGKAGLPNESNFTQTTKLKALAELMKQKVPGFKKLSVKSIQNRMDVLRGQVHETIGGFDATMTPEKLLELESPRGAEANVKAEEAAKVEPADIQARLNAKIGNMHFFKRAEQEQLMSAIENVQDPEKLAAVDRLLTKVEKDDLFEPVLSDLEALAGGDITLPSERDIAQALGDGKGALEYTDDYKRTKTIKTGGLRRMIGGKPFHQLREGGVWEPGRGPDETSREVKVPLSKEDESHIRSHLSHLGKEGANIESELEATAANVKSSGSKDPIVHEIAKTKSLQEAFDVLHKHGIVVRGYFDGENYARSNELPTETKPVVRLKEVAEAEHKAEIPALDRKNPEAHFEALDQLENRRVEALANHVIGMGSTHSVMAELQKGFQSAIETSPTDKIFNALKQLASSDARAVDVINVLRNSGVISKEAAQRYYEDLAGRSGGGEWKHPLGTNLEHVRFKDFLEENPEMQGDLDGGHGGEPADLSKAFLEPGAKVLSGEVGRVLSSVNAAGENAILFLDRTEPRVETAKKIQAELLDKGLPEIVNEKIRSQNWGTIEGIRQSIKDVQELTDKEVARAADNLRLRLNAHNEAGGIPASLFGDVVDYGRHLYNKGMDFVHWSGEMIRALGERVRAHLGEAWGKITGKEAPTNIERRDPLNLTLPSERPDLETKQTALFSEREIPPEHTGPVSTTLRNYTFGHGSSLGTLLDQIKVLSYDSALKGLIERMQSHRGALDKVKVQVGDIPLRDAAQFAVRTTTDAEGNLVRERMVTVAPDIVRQPEFERHVVHEAVHALLAEAVHDFETNGGKGLSKDALAAVKKLKRVYDDLVKAEIGDAKAFDEFKSSYEAGKESRDLYGLTNFQEFLAEGLNNPAFKKLIDKPGGLLQRMVQSVKEFFGASGSMSGQMIDDVFALADFIHDPNLPDGKNPARLGPTKYVEDQPETPDPLTGAPTRIGPNSGPLISRGDPRSAAGGGGGSKLGSAIRGGKAAGSIARRIGSRTTAHVVMANALRMSHAQFESYAKHTSMTPEEKGALLEARKNHPRVEWKDLLRLVGHDNTPRPLLDSWEKFDKNPDHVADYIKTQARRFKAVFGSLPPELEPLGAIHYASQSGREVATALKYYRAMIEHIMYATGASPNRELKVFASGAESIVFKDAARESVYKIMSVRGDGSVGLRPTRYSEHEVFIVTNPSPPTAAVPNPQHYFTAKRADAEAKLQGRAGTGAQMIELGPRLVSRALGNMPFIERLTGVGHNLPGFVATDVVGVLPSGDLLIKQPFVSGEPIGNSAIKKFVEDHGHVLLLDKSLSLDPAYRTLVLQQGVATPEVFARPMMVMGDTGDFYVVTDMRDSNGMSNGIEEYMFDPIVRKLTDKEIADSPILAQHAHDLQMNFMVGPEDAAPNEDDFSLGSERETTALDKARRDMGEIMAAPFKGKTYETTSFGKRQEAANNFLSQFSGPNGPLEAAAAINGSSMSEGEKIVTRGELALRLDNFARTFDDKQATTEGLKYAETLNNLRVDLIERALMEAGSQSGENLNAYGQVSRMWDPKSRGRDFTKPFREAQKKSLDKEPDAKELITRLAQAGNEAAAKTLVDLDEAIATIAKKSFEQSGVASDPYAQPTFDFFDSLARKFKGSFDQNRPVRLDIENAASDTISQQVLARLKTVTKLAKVDDKGFLDQLETEVRSMARKQVQDSLPKAPDVADPTSPSVGIGELTQKDIDALRHGMERATLAEDTYTKVIENIRDQTIKDPSLLPKLGGLLETRFDASRLREVTDAVKKATDLRELARKSLLDQSHTVSSLTQDMLGAAHLTADQAVASANYIHAAFVRDLKAAANKHIESMLKRATAERKVKPINRDSQHQILEMANLGIFKQEDVYNVLAKTGRWNLPTWDSKVVAEIERRAAAIQKLPNESAVRIKANMDLDNYIRRQTPQSAWALLMQLQSANILFRFSTMTVVPSSTALNSLSEASIMAMMQTGRGNRAKLLQAGIRSFANVFKDAEGKSRTRSEVEAMLKGDYSKVMGAYIEGERDKSGHKGNSQLEVMAQAHAEGESMKYKITPGAKGKVIEIPALLQGQKGTERLLAIVGRGMDLARFVPRLISTAHTLLRPAVSEMRIAAETVRKLQSDGLKPGTARFNAEYAKRMGETDGQLDAAWATAKAEAKEHGYDKYTMAKRANELINLSRDQEIVQRADEFSKTVTSSSDLYGFNGKVAGAIQQFVGDTYVAQPIVKFLRAASNLATIAENYLPIYSLKRLLYAPGSTLKPVERNASLRRFADKGPSTAAGARGKLERLLPDSAPRGVDFDIQLAKTVFAHVAMLPFFALMGSGLSDPDAELRLIGNGPSDYDGKRIFTAAGGKTDSIRFKAFGTYHYVSFQNLPGNSLFKLFAEFSDRYLEAPPADKEAWIGRLAVATMQAPLEVFSLGMLQGVSNLLEIEQGLGSSEKSDVNGAVRLLKNMASTTTSSFVPLAPGMHQFDIKNAHAGNFFESLIKAIPIANSGLKPELDMFGNPTQRTVMERYGKNETGDQVYQTLSHLGLAVKFPQSQHVNDQDIVDDDGKFTSREMTDDEHYRWVQQAGPDIYAMLNDPDRLQQLRDTYAKDGPEEARQLLAHWAAPIKNQYLKAIERGEGQ
ncbi:MAG: hypothetical protein ABI162_07120 [Luteolibacter sp.]